jgi:hypothetical protein
MENARISPTGSDFAAAVAEVPLLQGLRDTASALCRSAHACAQETFAGEAAADDGVGGESKQIRFAVYRSARLLSQQGDRIAEALGDALVRRVQQVLEPRSAAPAPQRGALSLVDESQLDTAILMATLAAPALALHQKLLELVNEALRTRSAAASAAEISQALGPAGILETYVSCIDPLSLEPEVRVLALRAFEKCVLRKLDLLYRQLLRQTGSVVPSEEPAPDVIADADDPGVAETAGAEALDSMLTLLAGRHRASSAREADRRPWSQRELLAALRTLQRRDETADAAPLLERLRRELANGFDAAAERRRIDDIDSAVVDLVELVFDLVVHHEDVPQPCQDLLRRLKPAYVRVAFLDRKLFLSRQHPARCLLDEVTGSAAAGGPADAGRQVHDHIRAMVERVLAEFDEDLALFGRVLEEFRSETQKHRARAEASEARSVQAAQGRERLAQAWQAVVGCVEPLLAERRVHELLADFLRRPWAQFLALVHLAGGNDAPAWRESVAVAQRLVELSGDGGDPRDRADRVTEASRELVPLIARGLSRVGYSSKDVSVLWVALWRVIVRPDSDVVNTGVRPIVPQGPTTQTALRHLDITAPATIAAPAADVPAPPPLPKGLVVGRWLQIRREDGTSERFKLGWIGVVRRKYLFVDRNGRRAMELDEPSLAELFADGRACLVDGDSRMSGAIDDAYRRLGAETAAGT